MNLKKAIAIGGRPTTMLLHALCVFLCIPLFDCKMRTLIGQRPLLGRNLIKLIKNLVCWSTSCIFSENPCAKMQKKQKSEKTICFSKCKFFASYKSLLEKWLWWIFPTTFKKRYCEFRAQLEWAVTVTVCFCASLSLTPWEPFKVNFVRELRTTAKHDEKQYSFSLVLGWKLQK